MLAYSKVIRCLVIRVQRAFRSASLIFVAGFQFDPLRFSSLARAGWLLAAALDVNSLCNEGQKSQLDFTGKNAKCLTPELARRVCVNLLRPEIQPCRCRKHGLR